LTTSNLPGSSSRDLQESFDRVARLRGDLPKRQNRINRQAQRLAWGLAALMEPGDYHFRLGLGVHAFDVAGRTCLAAAYMEERGDDSRYRYAVLCGGEDAKRALRTARLDPGDSDEPGPNRRVAPATFDEYEEFVERLPRYLNDVIRDLEAKVGRTQATEISNQRVASDIRSAAKRFGKHTATPSG